MSSLFKYPVSLNFFVVLLAALALSLGAVGCGDDDDDNGGGSSSEEAYCCLNGEFFDCPTGTAAQACVNDFEPGSCSADSSQNSRCEIDF